MAHRLYGKHVGCGCLFIFGFPYGTGRTLTETLTCPPATAPE